MSTAVENTKPKYELSAWSLTSLLPDTKEETLRTRLDELETKLKAFEARRAELNPEMDPAKLVEVMDDFVALYEKVSVLGAYPQLWFAADTQSPEALAMTNRMEQIATDMQNRVLFFDLWWKGLDDDEAAALMPSAEKFPDLHHYLADLRRTKRYTLDEKSEQLINLKDTDGMGALLKLYTMLTSRLEFTLDVNGEQKTLTRDALMAYVQGQDADLRAAAYQELYRVFGKEANILAQIYSNRVRDWANEQVNIRGYTSPIAVRNTANDIPDAAVDVLLDVARKNTGIFQRYFKLKAGWLGMDKLRRYDIYAPLKGSDKTIPYSEAADLVLETFAEFDEGVASNARRVLDEKQIDSEVRKGKQGGAFCATILPSITPFILMNYTGKVRDVATLAHEMGHAIHSMAAENHSALTQHPVLPLAETASVFAEQLLTHKLLATETDPLVRRELLASSVDDIYATVMRQAFFVIFERDAHAAIMANKSIAEINAMYMANLREQFGNSVDVAEEFQHEWVSIPHIFEWPFYCYAYSFGQLLVLALYRRYQQEGDAFKPGYLKLLAYGGSERPEIILREAGIDITDPAFWQGGFDVISEMIDEMESLS